MYKRDIYLDIDDNLNNYIKSVELDSNSRVWHFHLTVDYEPLDLTGKSVQFRAEKPDKTNVLNDCKIIDAEKGIVEVKLTQQVNAVSGHVKCLLKIIGEDGFVLKTKTFIVDVSKTLSDDPIVSSDEFGALEVALGKVQDIDNRFAETNAQLSELANKGTTIEVLERVTKEEIDRQIADGTMANLTIKDNSITSSKLKSSSVETRHLSETIYESSTNYQVEVSKAGTFENGMALQIPINLGSAININEVSVTYDITALTNTIESSYVKVAIGSEAGNLKAGTPQPLQKGVKQTISQTFSWSGISNALLWVYVWVKGTEPKINGEYLVENLVISINSQAVKFNTIKGYQGEMTIKPIEVGGLPRRAELNEIKTKTDKLTESFDNLFYEKRMFNIVSCQNSVNNLIQFETVYDLSQYVGQRVNVDFSYGTEDNSGNLSHVGCRCFIGNSPELTKFNGTQSGIESVAYTPTYRRRVFNNIQVTDDKKYVHAFAEFKLQGDEGISDFNLMDLAIIVNDNDIHYNEMLEGAFYGNYGTTPSYNIAYAQQTIHSVANQIAQSLDERLLERVMSLLQGATKLRGKSWNVMGDSISRGHSLQISQTYNGVIAERNEMDLVNYAVNGKKMTGASGNGYGPSMVVDYVNMRDGVDYVTIFGGTNDRGVALGEPDSTDIETIYGTLNVMCNGLINKYPTSKIFFITPLKCDGTQKTEQIVEAIKEVCGKYSIPVLDLYHDGTLCPMHDAHLKYLMLNGNDRLHPSIEGHKHLASRIQSFMESL